MNRQMPRQCKIYRQFGECAFEDKCRNSHEGEHENHGLIFAMITKMNATDPVVSLNEIDYYIPTGKWQRKESKEGDLVSYQVTSDKIEENNICRIVAVYGNSNFLPKLSPTMDLIKERPGFTLDTKGTKLYEDALSIEQCDTHLKCKKIGIHIAICKSDKLSVDQIPYYSRHKYTKFNRENQSYFKEKQCSLAISVDLHSSNKSVSIPHLSFVRITDNYVIDDDKSKCNSRYDDLLQCFTEMANKISLEYNAAYLCRTPHSWKETFIVGEAILSFNSAVVIYLKKISTTKAFFITGTPQGISKSTTQTIFVPKNVFPNVNDCDDSVLIDSIPMLIAQVNQILQSCSDSTNQLSPRYERDVKSSSELQQGTDVKFTAPMRKIQSFINQQVLFGLLINPDSCLYTKQEQLGILGIRFRNPKLYKSVINGIKDDFFRLDHISNKRMYKNVCHIKYAKLHKKCEKCEIANGKISMEFRNISCIEYSNFQVISFSKQAYDNVVSEFCGKQDSGELKKHLLAVENTKQEQESTYRKVSNTNTRLILRTGTTLHLQISNGDSYEENNLGLRLLRMGKNCHLCLLHMNHPELAFMSDRKDIRSLDLEEKITILKERKLTDEKLDTVRLTDVVITWSDDYYSGGSFKTDKKNITTGDALCICKEVKDIDGSNIEYVWNSHAVITKRIKEDVDFAVCTLSQTHGAPKEDNDYCVEIICMEKK